MVIASSTGVVGSSDDVIIRAVITITTDATHLSPLSIVYDDLNLVTGRLHYQSKTLRLYLLREKKPQCGIRTMGADVKLKSMF